MKTSPTLEMKYEDELTRLKAVSGQLKFDAFNSKKISSKTIVIFLKKSLISDSYRFV